METLQWIIALLLGAALLAALARRVGAPYPTFLAIGGVCLAFVPHAPTWTLDPHLALTLFVAPVLVDAAYDTSLRDLRDNWLPVGGLVIAAVGTTTIAVALTARYMVPDMSWAVAIALGAIVAPPDAAAATAVVRQVNLPHRILKILEGESLLNDATALLVYRLAIIAATAGSVSASSIAPMFLFVVIGSCLAGHFLARLFMRFADLITDMPTAIICQFSITFGVWIAAEEVGLSGILTIVVYAMTIAQRSSGKMPARMRVPIFAVWETVVFILNAFAFVLIGLQLRPIWERLGDSRWEYLTIALAVLAVTILARFAWVMSYNTVIRARIAKRGFRSRHGMAPPTREGGIVISWAGMRGIVTLAAAFAIPEKLPGGDPFPYRDLILLSAFVVVLGTLVVQGLTLKPLIRWMGLRDDDPVGREVRQARIAAYRAAHDAVEDDGSLNAKLLRKEYAAAVELCEAGSENGEARALPAGPLRLRAVAAARDRIVALRRGGTIGDDAYHILEEELDWAELSASASHPT
ncbi:sodium, potassium, lithium and rubidium/H(+) antiporter [Variibacter gotjawalensis]|uniref:Sodium, potassium, lithium and rubidium/H(+) antiporter n=1 Tax=Variibacter gotjawalensis TaxID=1333996 RepID=A0A0S3PYG6_9BRAD|nr:cation:proton antiporter [Variibacter gotjawalensis]NIK46779.1 CPA1 family monovalent cation:H+ antiporter [Variibacter gotjawalensis]RZS48683.1 sodium/proton antiporter (CPA1 family) [Variibacter gotjawalensis]BAT60942.1 sodium, potassium, lithium and rubidium/H(+) antiporter [Variibacter gotjawalensis]